MIGGEEEPAGCGLPWQGCVGLAGWVRRSAKWVSQPPIRPPAWAGAMTLASGGPGCSVSSSSAGRGPAQGDLRARPGPGDPLRALSPCRYLRRGGLRAGDGFGVGEQVPGAGEQLAGYRGGGDLLPAPFGDALEGGGELRVPF